MKKWKFIYKYIEEADFYCGDWLVLSKSQLLDTNKFILHIKYIKFNKLLIPQFENDMTSNHENTRKILSHQNCDGQMCASQFAAPY